LFVYSLGNLENCKNNVIRKNAVVDNVAEPESQTLYNSVSPNGAEISAAKHDKGRGKSVGPNFWHIYQKRAKNGPTFCNLVLH
jgi:hypothetical protein